MTPVYIVTIKSPVRQIVRRPAELVMRKLGWAQVKGRRHLLGVSAFFTEASAKKMKLALLIKQSKVQFLVDRHAMVIDIGRAQLADSQHPGWRVRELKE